MEESISPPSSAGVQNTPGSPLQRWRQSPLIQRSLAVRRRYRRWEPLLFFFGGVTWDGATLRRIDAWVDSLLLLSYILFLGALIVVALFVEHGRITHPRLVRYREWFPAAIQFLMGALFSAYFIFYLQSTSFQSESVVYLILLIALLIGNEFLRERLINPYFLFALYFLATATFFTFFLPVITKTMGYGMFWISSLASLGLLAGILYLLWRHEVLPDARAYPKIAGLVLGLFALLHLFYIQNWIPPVPMAIRDSGIYRGMHREKEAFAFKYARPAWYAFWQDYDRTFSYSPGDTVYCFSAVFAPTAFDTRVAHIWYRYEDEQERWMPRDTIPFRVLGGRDNGFRGYTMKRFVEPGAWRVDVKTEQMRTLGRIRFDIVETDAPVTDVVWKTFE